MKRFSKKNKNKNESEEAEKEEEIENPKKEEKKTRRKSRERKKDKHEDKEKKSRKEKTPRRALRRGTRCSKERLPAIEAEVTETDTTHACDAHTIVIRVGNRTFPADRLILIKYSQYFRFHPDIIDGDIICIDQEIPVETFECIHQWVTTDRGIGLDTNNAVAIFSAARKLKMRKLVNQCGHFIRDFLINSESDPMPVYEKISQSYESDLFRIAHQLVMQRAIEIINSPYFLRYNIDQLCLLLRDDYIVVPTERTIFDAVVRWLAFDFPSRCDHARTALECVRMTSMSGSELLECMDDERSKCIRELRQCKDAFFQAFHYKLAVDTNMEYLLPNIATAPRKALTESDAFKSEKSKEISVAIESLSHDDRRWDGSVQMFPKIIRPPDKDLTLNGKDINGSLENPQANTDDVGNMAAGSDYDCVRVSRRDYRSEYKSDSQDTESKGLESTTSTGSDTSSHEDDEHERTAAAITIQKYFRGYGTRAFIKKMHRAASIIQSQYRVHLIEKRQKKRLASRLCRPQLMPVLNLTDTESIVLFSRPDDNGQCLLRYDPRRDRWSSIIQMQQPMEGFATAEIEGKIFVTGGMSSVRQRQRRSVSTTLSLDTRNATWSRQSCMLGSRREHALISRNGKLYAVGGIDSHNSLLSSMECFQPVKNTWEPLSPMPQARASAAICVHRNLIWVCGGIADCPRTRQLLVVDRVDCYDILRNYWYKQASLPVPLCSASALSVRGTLWVVGGSSSFKSTDGSDVVYAFDSISQKWTQRLKLPRPRCKAVAVEISGNLYFIGGVANPLTADCYCLDTGHWFTIRTLPRPTLSSFVVLPAAATSAYKPTRPVTRSCNQP